MQGMLSKFVLQCLTFLSLILLSSSVQASDYASCLAEKLQGITHDAAVKAITEACHAKYLNRGAAVKPASVPTKTTLIDGRYRDNGNGTITDTRTNLIWMRCSQGQHWTGSTCAGVAMKMNWNDAFKTAMSDSYAGHIDWRLPTIDELDTLVLCPAGRRISARPGGHFVIDTDGVCHGSEYNNPKLNVSEYNNPKININAFPNTPAGWFWSSTFWSPTPNANVFHLAWVVVFGEGSVRSGFKTVNLNVRFVADGRFRDNGNGTITDTRTNLTWMRCSQGQQWTGSTCAGVAMQMNWNDALKTAMSYSYAGHSDWRLPTIDELDTLVLCPAGRRPSVRPSGIWVMETDGLCHGSEYNNPKININVFPNTPPSTFWSSSESVEYFSNAWWLDFQEGDVDHTNGKNINRGVRFVRAGQ